MKATQRQTSEATPQGNVYAARTAPSGLQIGKADDWAEHEADRVADEVMSSGMGSRAWSFSQMEVGAPLRRKCDCGGAADSSGECEECKKKKLQRRMGNLGLGVGNGSGAPPIVHEVLRSPGRPMDAVTRAFMEPRFGFDFGRVRVHTDARAAESAHAVGARAYTVGTDVVFAAGQYAPHTEAGARLLAHEMAHVAQQSHLIVRREPDAKALKEFDQRADQIRKNPVLAKLGAEPKRQVAEILAIIRKRDDALDLMTKLEQLFATPFEDPKAQSAETEIEIGEAVTKNEERLKKPSGTSHLGEEEAISADKSRAKNFKKRQGRDGSTFLIDATDVTNIAVIVKVQLVSKKKTKENEKAIAQIESLEDSIEKRASTLGYSLDLQFVKKSGPDVFTINVDTGAWADAGNVAGGDATFAHELHHLLGLEEDRYDYTRHATNKRMPIATRIHWFRQEFKKVIDNNPESIMNTNAKSPLDDDVCMVAGKRSKADIAACVKERSEARNKIIEPALSRAAGWAKKADERVASDAFLTTGVAPARIAAGIFDHNFSITRIRRNVAAARQRIVGVTLKDFRLVSALVEGCEDDASLTPANTLPLELCPQFFRNASTAKSEALLRGAYHLAGVGGAGQDTPCVKDDCTKSCGGEQSADTWARFTKCFAEL